MERQNWTIIHHVYSKHAKNTLQIQSIVIEIFAFKNVGPLLSYNISFFIFTVSARVIMRHQDDRYLHLYHPYQL